MTESKPNGTITPETVATDLASKLSARTRHVSVFLGAGAARAAGLPDLKGLQATILTSLNGADKERVTKLFENRNLEETLSYLRRLVSILEPGQSLAEFTATSADDLQKAITRSIVPALAQEKADLGPFKHLANWLSGNFYRLPVEVFTINYDLLIETGLEATATPYFDGFVGHIKGRFRPELVDTVDPAAADAVPPAFVRLWKLHGSINWSDENVDGRKQIVRLGTPAPDDTRAAIYPSDEKYDQSRRVPFVVLMDRFRKALEMPESITLVSGYSFGDQHLNEMLFDAARTRPRSEITVFCFGAIPEQLAEVAKGTRNLSVLASQDAIVGGQTLAWVQEEQISGVWDGSKFLLGDFAALARFLATKARMPDALE